MVQSLAEGSLTPKMSASQKETGTEKRIPFSVPDVHRISDESLIKLTHYLHSGLPCIALGLLHCQRQLSRSANRRQLLYRCPHTVQPR